MKNITKEEIKTRWDNAPIEIRQEIFSFKNDDIIEQIASNFSLDDTQHKQLLDGVFYVLLGFIEVKGMIGYIRNKLHLSPQVSIELFKILDERIFSRVANELRSFSLSFKVQEDIDDVQEPQTQETVSLKREPQEIKQKEEYAPASFSQIQTPPSQKEASQEEVVVSKKEDDQVISDEPFMIHSSDEIISSQSAQKPRIRRSLGGVSGVFGSSVTSKDASSSLSQAQVEIPHSEEKVKTVHYSDYEPS